MIGRTNAGSGTGGLLINVVGGLTQPENPTYGTVWLETEVPINGWEILSVSPDWEAAEGHVCLQDAPSTSVDTPNFAVIDAAKKPYGAIWERLIGAFQRINGEWVRLNGAVWRDGVWTPFFGATINITYPVGSVCTATDGATTLTAPDSSGVWACVVPNAGIWTVTAKTKDGADQSSKYVDITEDGQIENLNIWYGKYFFRHGLDTNEEIFGSVGNLRITISDTISAAYQSGVQKHAYGTALFNPQNFGFTRMCVDMEVTYASTENANYKIKFGLTKSGTETKAASYSGYCAAYKDFSSSVSRAVYELDISNVNQNCFAVVGGLGSFTVYDVWFE